MLNELVSELVNELVHILVSPVFVPAASSKRSGTKSSAFAPQYFLPQKENLYVKKSYMYAILFSPKSMLRNWGFEESSKILYVCM